LRPIDSDEKVARLHASRVIGDSGDLDVAVALDGRAGHAARQLMELHSRRIIGT
jgi:hypothetical protein